MEATAVKENFVKRFGQVIAQIGRPDEFLNSLTQMLAELFETLWANLALVEEESGQYVVRAAFHEQEDFPDLVDKSAVKVPLFAGQKAVGVLNLGARKQGRLFTSEELELISEIIEILTPVIQLAAEHEKIKEQSLHRQSILDNLVCGVVAVNPDEKITVFNRAAERILRLKAEDVLGKDLRALCANLASLFLDTLHKDKSYHRKELYVLPENILIGASTAQFYDVRGKLLGAYMVFTALSEIKRKQGLSRQKTLDRYWSNATISLASEVKGALLDSKVYTEMFPKKYEDAEFRWNFYSALKRDMRKLDDFVERMLKFAHPKDAPIEPCRVEQIMDAAVDAAFKNIDAAEVELEKKYQENLGTLACDWRQLQDAFAYIISNALEATGKGKITISIQRQEDSRMLNFSLPEAAKELPLDSNVIIVKISDSGSGILPEQMPNLFDPFFTTKKARTGLGLALARKIIKRHQGLIRAESSPGEGSTFWVCLPAF